MPATHWPQRPRLAHQPTQWLQWVIEAKVDAFGLGDGELLLMETGHQVPWIERRPRHLGRGGGERGMMSSAEVASASQHGYLVVVEQEGRDRAGRDLPRMARQAMARPNSLNLKLEAPRWLPGQRGGPAGQRRRRVVSWAPPGNIRAAMIPLRTAIFAHGEMGSFRKMAFLTPRAKWLCFAKWPFSSPAQNGFVSHRDELRGRR